MDSWFYKGLRDFDTRCSFLTVGRQMTLNAYTVDLTEALFHHSPGTKLSSQQEDNTDSTLSSTRFHLK